MKTMTDTGATSRLLEKRVPLYHYLWDERTKHALLAWGRLMVSAKGMWAWSPAIAGILFVYWAKSSGHLNLLNKGYNETLALWLMAATVAVFLVRLALHRLEVDLLMLILSVNFLCREIHFAGTDATVFIVFGILVFWALFWKNRLLSNIEGGKFFQAAVTGTAFCYLMALLIQKRVFRATRLPLLPDEEAMHVPLEEVLENVSHSFLLVIGVIAFFSLSRRPPPAPRLDEPLTDDALTHA